MKLKGKSIRSLSKLIKIAGTKQKVRLAINIDDIDHDSIKNLGFSDELSVGDYIIPSCIGDVTDFNANGTTIVRSDLPKEPHSIMVYTTTRDWHGG
jgi:hypothetical protein